MPIIGIDLGTTFSAVAYLDHNGKPVTIPNSEGELTTPSVVLFDKTGEVIVGREARRVALSEPARVAQDVKRYMGDTHYPKLIDGQTLTPAAISGLILRKLRIDAEKRIGKIEGAVITVPAYFDEGRRQVTAAAGEMAGLKVLDIINEPTSAALAYAYGTLIQASPFGPVASPTAVGIVNTVMVYDLGGGTFDVTILRIKGKELTVLATAGDVRLGGRDWDEHLFNFMADQFLRAHGNDPRDNPISYQNLMLAAEETKKVLSQRQKASYVVNHAGKTFNGEVTREQFNTMTEDLLYRSESRLTRVLEQAHLSWDQIDEVLAVGGSTRMPQVPAMLRKVTGKEPNCSLSPDEAVAHGAAIHAASCLVKASQPAVKPPPLPATSSAPVNRPATPMDAENPAPSPAEPVGLLRMFASKVIDLLLGIKTTNVNAHSLGVVVTLENGFDRVSVLIPSNTPLPASITKRYGTLIDNQTSVTVRIVEGESRIPEECIPVGSCQIRSLPPGLKKASPIDITFTYDNSGRLHAKAMEPFSRIWAATAIERRFGHQREKPRADELVSGFQAS